MPTAAELELQKVVKATHLQKIYWRETIIFWTNLW